MKTVFVLFNSLNRHLLGAYGGRRIPTPNFDRLAARGLTFDRHYVGSLPCMPARRDMLTGRLYFPASQLGTARAVRQRHAAAAAREGRLQPSHHRPLPLLGGRRRHLPQPLQLLRIRPRPGGRSLEGDGAAALGAAARDVSRAAVHYRAPQILLRRTSSTANSSRRKRIFRRCSASPTASTSSTATATPTTGCCRSKPSIRTSRSTPRPASRRHSTPAGTDRSGTGRAMAVSTNCRPNARNCAPIIMPWSRCATSCSAQLLDYFDRHDLWKDTALVVTTDHGFLLGEHDFWAKNRMNLYEEIVHIPLFIHDPRRPQPGARSGVSDPVDRSGADYPRSVRRAAGEGNGRTLRIGSRRRMPPNRCAKRRCSAISAAPSTSPTAATPTTASRPT